MMLGGGDLNLTKFRQGFGQLTMENWKQAILEHELIFRNQVRELHRLYWTQKNLMIEHHKRTFNLQLPADNYINAVRNDLDNNLSISSVDGAEKETVGVGKEEGIVENGTRSLDSSSFNEVIVLDDSLDLGRHEGDPKEFQSGGFEFLTQKALELFETKPTGPNDKGSISMEGNNAPCAPSTIHFSEGEGRSLLEQNPHFYRERLDDSCLTSAQNHSRNIKRSTHELIDLNLSIEDESCHHQNDPDPSATSSYEKKAGWLFRFGQDKGPVGDNKRQDSDVTVSRDSSNHPIAEDEAQQPALIGKFSLGCNSECSSSDEKGAEEPASVSITDDSVITQMNSPGEEDVATVTAAEILMAISFGSSANATVPVDRMC